MDKSRPFEQVLGKEGERRLAITPANGVNPTRPIGAGGFTKRRPRSIRRTRKILIMITIMIMIIIIIVIVINITTITTW